mmetsp:Transcript_25098/g.68596  ORF Transcript_25098/g.68596 Transcript_25098/m.68596 type:complete len:202 (+) Transcript_25098:184-789(+)
MLLQHSLPAAASASCSAHLHLLVHGGVEHLLLVLLLLLLVHAALLPRARLLGVLRGRVLHACVLLVGGVLWLRGDGLVGLLGLRLVLHLVLRLVLRLWSRRLGRLLPDLLLLPLLLHQRDQLRRGLVVCLACLGVEVELALGILCNLPNADLRLHDRLRCRSLWLLGCIHRGLLLRWRCRRIGLRCRRIGRHRGFLRHHLG